MSRKSRKHPGTPIAPALSRPLRVAAYLRIPVEKPSSSHGPIENQLRIIEAFLDHRPDLTLISTYTDTDDRAFQREGFQQIIQAIERSEIDCVLVTDISILGRNLIEIGYYIESYFPRHNIRLISISDQLKTAGAMSNWNKRNSNHLSSNHDNLLRDQIVLLQYQAGKINFQIERQTVLIESLEPNVQNGIITSEESKELRFAFESKQNELVKLRNQFLEQIQQIRSKLS